MDLQPDKIFRDKLSSYSTPPPPGAWDRIDKARQSYKRYFLIAASVLLIVLSGVAVLQNADPAPQDVAVISGEQNETKEQPDVQIDMDAPSVPEKPGIGEGTPSVPPKELTHRPNAVQKTVQPEANTTSIDVPPALTKGPAPTDSNQVVHQLSHNQPLDEVKAEIMDRHVVTIVYSLEVSEKFIRKPSVVVTEERKAMEEKQRLPDIASGIKYGSHGIGDLRQIKDELLSFEFLANNNTQSKSDKK